MVLEPEMMRKIADMSDKYKMSFFRVLTWFAENEESEVTDEDVGARIEQLLSEIER